MTKFPKFHAVEKASRELRATPVEDGDDLDFYPSQFCQIAFPYRPVPGEVYTKRSGKMQIKIFTPDPWGIPSGPSARLSVIYLSTEATLMKNAGMEDPRKIFIGRIGQAIQNITGTDCRSGGAKGNITRMRRNFNSICRTAVNIENLGINDPDNANDVVTANFTFTDRIKRVKQDGFSFAPEGSEDLFDLQTHVWLSREFYTELVEHAVPMNRLAIRALWPSCLHMDIYLWVTFRANALIQAGKYDLWISWKALQEQFGQNYSPEDRRKFRARFTEGFELVAKLFPVGGVRMDVVGERVRFALKSTAVQVVVPGQTKVATGLVEPPREVATEWGMMSPGERRRALRANAKGALLFR